MSNSTQDMQETLSFLKKILPKDGIHYVAIFKPGFVAPAHKVFASLEDMASAIEKLDAGEWTVYHACGSYKEEFVEVNGKKKYRVKENWSHAKAFWVDIDCGEDKAAEGKGYATKKDAITAIKQFCENTGLPKPMIVDSGYGIHIYWNLENSISHGLWQAVALKLKNLLKECGVIADPSRTADFASVLRPVGSYNKKKTPKRVAIIEDGTVIKFDEFRASIEGHHKLLAITTHSQNNLTSTELLNYEQSDLEMIVAGCKQIALFKESGGLNYEHWRGSIGIAKYCKNGTKYAHEWSSVYPNYSESETQSKLDSWQTPPTTCDFFYKVNTTVCSNCSHIGRIKSPISLGKTSNTLDVSPNTNQNFGKDIAIRFPHVSQKGKPKAHTQNLAAILGAYQCDVRYNLMTKKCDLLIPGLKSVTDEYDNSAITFVQDLATLYDMPINRIPELINHLGSLNPYCPVQRLINSKPWDGHSRFEQFASQISSNEPVVVKFILKKWLLQAVAAVFEKNGISAAGVLVLVGHQGAGKTLFFKKLGSLPEGAFLEGATLNPSDKDCVSLVISHWIVELGELDATFRKADIAQIKAFTTRNTDKFRRPYARKDSEFPRRTVFCASVNETEFLHDPTGNRRFWPIQVTDIVINSELDFQQLWAEVKTWYDSGETWHLTQEEQALLSEHNRQFETADPTTEKVMGHYDFGTLSDSSCRWLTATKIASEIGIDKPSKSDLTRISSAVRASNGNQFKKSNGNRLLKVPVVKGSQ